jgi:hypothetical protein
MKRTIMPAAGAAVVHTHAEADVTGLATDLAGKATTTALTTHTSNTTNPHAVTQAQVGLGNVSNLAPADLPVSTATQTALGLKLDSADFNAVADDGLPGLFGPTCVGWAVSGSATALTSGTLYLYRVRPERTYSITKVWFNIGTASGTNDACEIAVYNSDCSSQLATTGSTPGLLNATGDKTPSLTVTLTRGNTYYVAFLAASTAALRFWTYNQTAMAGAFGSAAPLALGLTKTGQSIPLASSLTGLSLNPTGPFLVLRES